jgi:hypothetical protein
MAQRLPKRRMAGMVERKKERMREEERAKRKD